MAVLNINAKTLKKWLDDKEAVLVDVREPAEYAEKNINGSVLIPLGGISRDALPEFTGKKLVIHCKAGMRSLSACQKLVAEDPKLEIYNLQGGILAWE